VQESTRGPCTQALAHAARVDGFTTEQHLLDAGKSAGSGAYDLVEQRGGQKQGGNAASAQLVGKPWRIEGDITRDDYKA
jgi:hypothetical protein